MCRRGSGSSAGYRGGSLCGCSTRGRRRGERRIGGVAGIQVSPVDDAVIIRIRIVRTRTGLVLLAIPQTVSIRIRVKWIGSQPDLIAISQAVPVTIRVAWIGPACDLVSVVSAIVIHIGVARIGQMGLDLVTIQQTIAIRIGHKGVGLMGIDLISIRQSICIGVRQERIGTECGLAIVGQSIAICISRAGESSLRLIECSRLGRARGGGSTSQRDEDQQAHEQKGDHSYR